MGLDQAWTSVTQGPEGAGCQPSGPKFGTLSEIATFAREHLLQQMLKPVTYYSQPEAPSEAKFLGVLLNMSCDLIFGSCKLDGAHDGVHLAKLLLGFPVVQIMLDPFPGTL